MCQGYVFLFIYLLKAKKKAAHKFFNKNVDGENQTWVPYNYVQILATRLLLSIVSKEVQNSIYTTVT